jgi:hypothetical protein
MMAGVAWITNKSLDEAAKKGEKGTKGKEAEPCKAN